MNTAELTPGATAVRHVALELIDIGNDSNGGRQAHAQRFVDWRWVAALRQFASRIRRSHGKTIGDQRQSIEPV